MRNVFRRRLPAALLCACLIGMMLPMTAMAKSKTYVPTEGTVTREEADGSKETHSVKYVYRKDGKIASRTYIYPSFSDTYNYSWSKNFVTSIYNVESDGDVYTWSYKYKKKLLSSFDFSSPYNKSHEDYTWKKKTGTYTSTETSGGATIAGNSGTVKVNGKKQMVSGTETSPKGKTVTTACKYYGNGNLKSKVTDGTTYDYGSEDTVIIKSVTTYNKAGYKTGSTSYYNDGSVSTTTYSYVMDSKMKCPTQVKVTYTHGKYSHVTTYTFTAFQKVKRTWNCDGRGNTLPLAAN